jgi:hypothetical protein
MQGYFGCNYFIFVSLKNNNRKIIHNLNFSPISKISTISPSGLLLDLSKITTLNEFYVVCWKKKIKQNAVLSFIFFCNVMCC